MSYCLWDYWLGDGSLSHSSSPHQVKVRVSGCHFFSSYQLLPQEPMLTGSLSQHSPPCYIH
jgi:hypothetical protein